MVYIFKSNYKMNQTVREETETSIANRIKSGVVVLDNSIEFVAVINNTGNPEVKIDEG
ncbi:hypothetical protein [Ruminiclostridium papyrosolvens]|uniref:Uncharacterized protein n=1 Tax=Ruminiclostridium papyrosolvens C7 TaxID=1330534 RepID=U4R2G7_9FIRM|nr:hypothetical protein [Ruminiclostridium papyrosolvens]EPR12492.1 hypothetical protein L323_08030 [Ruminiclostridium papyrosolvens C7]